MKEPPREDQSIKDAESSSLASPLRIPPPRRRGRRDAEEARAEAEDQLREEAAVLAQVPNPTPLLRRVPPQYESDAVKLSRAVRTGRGQNSPPYLFVGMQAQAESRAKVAEAQQRLSSCMQSVEDTQKALAQKTAEREKVGPFHDGNPCDLNHLSRARAVSLSLSLSPSLPLSHWIAPAGQVGRQRPPRGARRGDGKAGRGPGGASGADRRGAGTPPPPPHIPSTRAPAAPPPARAVSPSIPFLSSHCASQICEPLRFALIDSPVEIKTVKESKPFGGLSRR